MATYILSDTHFGHKKILDFERFNFKSIEEHDDFIVEKWNSVIKEKDIVYHLGDVIFAQSKDSLQCILSKLNGYKILIKGNHDKKTNNYYLKNGFDEVYNHPVYYSDNIILSHQPVLEAYNNPYVINIHGHLHGANLNLKNFICVAMDQIHYTPVNIEAIVKISNELKTRKNSFLNEWYGKYYNFYIDKGIVYDENGDVDLKKTKSIIYKKIKLSKEQLEVLNKIIEITCRFFMGQFDYVFLPLINDYNKKEEIDDIILKIKKTYNGLGLNVNYGIYCKETPQISKILYDIHQKLRYKLYLLEKEKYENSFYSKRFLKCSDENEIFISRNLDKFIVNVPSNIYYILVLAMEVYISIFKFNCTILSKYIQLYAKTKIDFNSINRELVKLKKYCSFDRFDLEKVHQIRSIIISNNN